MLYIILAVYKLIQYTVKEFGTSCRGLVELSTSVNILPYHSQKLRGSYTKVSFSGNSLRVSADTNLTPTESHLTRKRYSIKY